MFNADSEIRAGESRRRGARAALLGLLCALAFSPAAHADVRIEEEATTLEARVTRWTFIKGDRRSIVTRAEPKGTLYNAGARYGAYVEIARPDRDLIWELDPQERSYREITFEQFNRLLQRGIQAPRTANEQPLRSLYRSETTAIEVAPTGKTRRIAGYQAEQVLARVVVGALNQVSGNRFSFTFDQEIWLTKDEALLRELEEFEAAYVERFGTAASLQQVQVLAGPWNDAFVQHLRAVNDRVRALKGFPLAVTTTVTEEAVAQGKGEKSTQRKFTISTSEVRRITVATLPDSEFELPVGYINSDTKVAVAAPVAPPEGTAPPAAAAGPVPQPTRPVAAAPSPVAQPAPAAVPATPPTPPAPVAAAPVPPPPVASAPAPAGAPEAGTLPRAAPPRVAVRPTPAPAVVTAPPTNVNVRGGPRGAPAGERPLASASAAGALQGNYPVLPGGAGSVGSAGTPSTVVVDEPDLATPRKRGKKRKTLLPLY